MKEQTQNIRTIYQGIKFLRGRGVAMELKNRDPQKAHLQLLLNIHVKFKFPISFGGQMEGHFFSRSKEKKPFISLLIELED